ncbi:alkaline phosphatase PhoX [Flaviaesturariibacter amylovorans]|uniref:DUF839 domain-containing protein n=1 Tax=Flaviaesturariibacter amylovorans TaxID=1084520 RepID=A0ABP8GR53_9BACT
MKYLFPLGSACLLAAGLSLVPACKKTNSDSTPEPVSPVQLKAHSVTAALAATAPGVTGVDILPLLSSEDRLAASPDFVFGPQPDGAGLLRKPDGTGYVLLNNHEIIFSVSRVHLDNSFKPVQGEYLVDAAGGGMRLCSATMATMDEHGFGPVFLTAGESSQESMVHAINPFGSVSDRSRNDRTLPALGKANMENAVPLPKAAYPGRTVVFIGEDQSYSAGHQSAGQLLMYLSDIVGDLQTGELYALKRMGGDQVEMNMSKGSEYDVEFVKLPNIRSKTGAEINTIVNGLGAIRFSRVEDVDYRKGSAANNREVFFTATGQAVGGANPEPGYTMWGRVYSLKLDAANPTKGKLQVVAEGDSNPGQDLINPDNICVTENYMYIQEDGDSYYAAAQHDSYVWQMDLRTGQYKPWIVPAHNRTDAAWNAKFNTTGEMRKGSWEWGAMIDISDAIGKPNTFLLNIHPHTWQNPAFANADRSGLTTNREGGQTMILTGVPR